ncbi:MBL fold metallo-hydrolase [Candidatus Woesearchaeota archaeon]|nr:MBL fold metallo-hydrolase [Candidatus Woesearchaeota archaeon]
MSYQSSFQTSASETIVTYSSTGISVSRIILPTPFGVGPVNVYLIRHNDHTTLVDAGPNDAEAQQHLTQGLASLGVTSLDALVLTHHHFDHRGLAAYIVNEFGPKVIVHRHGRRYLVPTEQGDAYTPYETIFKGAGFAPRVVSHVARIFEGYTRYGSTVDTTRIRTVNQGYDDTLGGEIIHCPGHTEDSIGLLVGPYFLCGDTFWRDKTPNPFFSGGNSDRGLKAFLATLDTLCSRDLGTALPGHGDPIEDHRAYIDFVKAHHAKRADAIIGLLRGSTGKTAADIVHELFAERLNGKSRFSADESFLALAEVIGNLEMFEENGQARREEHNGTFLYHAL